MKTLLFALLLSIAGQAHATGCVYSVDYTSDKTQENPTTQSWTMQDTLNGQIYYQGIFQVPSSDPHHPNTQYTIAVILDPVRSSFVSHLLMDGSDAGVELSGFSNQPGSGASITHNLSQMRDPNLNFIRVTCATYY